MKLAETLTPVFEEDKNEWQDIISGSSGTLPPLFWYGGAALDTLPIVALHDGSFPRKVQDRLSRNIFPVLTDYNSKIVAWFKYVYDNFDKEEFRLDIMRNQYWFLSQVSEIEILQMIPLRLFDSKTLQRIRQQYQGFHKSATSSVIPDDTWHFIFVVFEYHGKEYEIIYGLIENLTFWKEVVEPFDLVIEAFCALRVGGKSGSWDNTHSPTTGKLFNAIRTSDHAKPKVWIADACLELRKIWQEIEPHEKGFYGQMHFFEADWLAIP